MSDTTQILTRAFDAAPPTRARDSSRVRDYVDLLKPRVMSLVVFTGLVGVLIAPGHAHPFAAALAVLAIALGSGAAGAINMWYERDLDALMTRTANRPLPAGRVAPDDALGLGVLLSIFSILLMAVATNYVAAALLAAAILFYVFVYTIWLKRRTPQNIVIGGAAGAFPPVIGWAAVTGSVDLMPLLLFAIVFFWTPPHFWSLALFANSDYQRAGVPMLPVVAGAKETRKQIVIYTLLLVPLSLAPWLLGFSGLVYGLSAAALGLGFIVSVWRVATDRQDASGVSQTNDAPARMAFKFSILYLFALFAALAVDRLAG
jgi:protoheme IX farnesyltransferase